MHPTQFDTNIRIVSLDNLTAMCREISSSCHTFHISEISNRFASVEYSNCDEYGYKNPMVAMFPLVPIYNTKGVMLTIHRVINDSMDGEGWQNFQILLGCPVLWRNPKNDKWAVAVDKLQNNP